MALSCLDVTEAQGNLHGRIRPKTAPVGAVWSSRLTCPSVSVLTFGSIVAVTNSVGECEAKGLRVGPSVHFGFDPLARTG
jgi:hypothetical protein